MKLLQPRPLGSGADALNRAPCDAEIDRNKPVDSLVSADGLHVGFRQSRLPMALSPIAGAVYCSVRLVFRPRHPSKIGERRIPRVAIKMGCLMFWRSRPDKSLKNKDVDTPLVAGADVHDSVAPHGLLRRQDTPCISLDDFLSPSALAAHFPRFAAHVSKARNGVVVAAYNPAPFFSGGFCNHHCIIGASV